MVDPVLSLKSIPRVFDMAYVTELPITCFTLTFLQIPKERRRDQLVQEGLKDMRIVYINEKNIHEYMDIILQIPI